jgi:allantoinase
MNGEALDRLVRGDLVLKDGVIRDSAVGVKDGRIVGLFHSGQTPAAKEVFDHRGCLIFPGAVDAHVHSYSVPGAEGFESSTAAAAAGGVTTLIEMPYDAGAPTTTPEAFREKIDRVKGRARVDVALLATLKKDGSPEVIEPLVALGACGFKLSLFETDPDRFPRIPDGVLWEILPRLARYPIPVGFHAENDDLIFHLMEAYRRKGETHPQAHCETRPPISETLAVLKLLELAHWTRFALHIYHASHPRSIDLIRHFRIDGVDVSVETCPHYLLLSQRDMDRLRALGKINPPLRTEEETEAMWDALRQGDIDMVTSDHAPWPLERKQSSDIFANASGAPGVETLLPLLFSEGMIERGFSAVRIAQIVAEKPARRFRLYPRKGHIGLGADADFAVIDPRVRWTIHGADLHSSARWTPFEGMEVTGKVIRTILRGNVIFDGREVLARPGSGQFIAATKE